MESACNIHDYAFISLGANLPSKIGDPLETIEFAIKEISGFSNFPLLVSSLYESFPVDCPPESPRFLNAVIGLKPIATETADSLLKKLQDLELVCGRKRSGITNEPRTLDLDLISFRDVQCDTGELILPHPRFHERRFVLEPLLEISGNQVMPGHNDSLEDLLQEIQGQDIKRI